MTIIAQKEWSEVMEPATPTDTLQQTVVVAAASMNQPPWNTPPEKLTAAMDLVLSDKVQRLEDGTFTVQGSKPWTINGLCSCPQGQHNKTTKWCRHMVSVELWKRVQQCQGPPVAETPTWPAQAKAQPALTPETPANHHVPAQYTVELHGKAYITLEGLLIMAHERGLESLTVSLLQASPDLAICEASCELNGKHFSISETQHPTNVNKTVAKHFIRCAASRAKARVLRSALGIGMCSLEEID